MFPMLSYIVPFKGNLSAVEGQTGSCSQKKETVSAVVPTHRCCTQFNLSDEHVQKKTLRKLIAQSVARQQVNVTGPAMFMKLMG